jgi:RimJ/RimL family protein N-acetyltransferase
VRIETERLLLRRLTLDDVDHFVALHRHPAVGRFVGGFDHDQATERLRADQSHWWEHGYGLLAMTDRRTGRFLGRVGLKYWPQFDETEVGWALDPEVWGRGFASEAARACVDWGFANLDVPYLTAMIRPDNERSIRVAERLGLTPLRHDVLLGGPVIVYAVTREAWPDSAEG